MAINRAERRRKTKQRLTKPVRHVRKKVLYGENDITGWFNVVNNAAFALNCKKRKVKVSVLKKVVKDAIAEKK